MTESPRASVSLRRRRPVQVPAANHQQRRLRSRPHPGDARCRCGPDGVARGHAADFGGQRPSPVEHPARRTHDVPVGVAGPNAADVGQLGKRPPVRSLQLAGVRIEQGEIGPPRIGDERNRGVGLRLPTLDQGQPFPAVTGSQEIGSGRIPFGCPPEDGVHADRHGRCVLAHLADRLERRRLDAPVRTGGRHGCHQAARRPARHPDGRGSPARPIDAHRRPDMPSERQAAARSER